MNGGSTGRCCYEVVGVGCGRDEANQGQLTSAPSFLHQQARQES